jgi:hypothetical protein
MAVDGLTVRQLRKILDDLTKQGREDFQVALVIWNENGSVVEPIFRMEEDKKHQRFKLFLPPDVPESFELLTNERTGLIRTY